MESSTVQRRAVGASTIAEAFRLTAEDRAEETFLRTKEEGSEITFGEALARVDAIAGGLAGLGLEPGDTLALLIGNRPEFHLVDLAAIMLGVTPFSIYMQYTPGQIQFVVQDAGAKVLVCEQQFLAGVLEAREQLPDLHTVIVIDGDAPEGVVHLSEIEGDDPGFDVSARVAAIGPQDVLTLIYTSGTTGPPKGVQLSHNNLMAAVKGIESLVQFPENARVISWLPSAHIAERAAHHYLPIVYGFEITSCPNAREVLGYIQLVRPSWFFAVPRIWEKLKSGLEAMVAGQPEEQRAVTQQALDDSLERVRLIQAGEAVPAELEAAFVKADAEIFSGLRTMLGFDQIEAVNVGAAPTPREVIEFMHAIGIPLAELWGMSETCGAGCTNPPEKIKIGTVGPAQPGTQVKLAEDGELLMKSDVVMLGYRNLPEKTAEAIDADGWLHTGDIATIDDEGYVTLVDRKKEIIINAAGKNMSPANIESTLKSASSLIGQACVIGDARPYNTALIVLDADFAPAFAAQKGIADASLESLAEDEQVREAVQAGVDLANSKLARVEQIKKFVIVSGDWLPGGDELTPTMKLKRKPIAAKYDDAIAGMYVR